MGAPLAILVMASGVLLGVIALFWASLRILSGDAALSPELEALDATAHAVDALASRKKMLVRALKDLENERALGKLEEDDFEQLSHTYRGRAEGRPHADRRIARAAPSEGGGRCARVPREGRSRRGGSRGTQPREEPKPASKKAPEAPESEPEEDDEESDTPDAEESAPVVAAKVEKAPAKKADAPTRVECRKCKTSNEVDASFCKKCGASLAKEEVSDEA